MSIKQTKSSIKRQAFASFIAIFLVGLILPSATAVEEERSSAIGHYQISIGDQPTRTIDFNARLERDGSTTGEMAFRDSPNPGDPKASNKLGGEDDALRPFSLRAIFDCLTVNGNSAMMSGHVTEASLERYIGKRVLLVVQDNGHGVDAVRRDKLTWGIYRAAADLPLVTDFERPDDQAGITWIATDAERTEETGVLLSQKTEEIGCHSFPLSAFSFIDARQGYGKIQVRSGVVKY